LKNKNFCSREEKKMTQDKVYKTKEELLEGLVERLEQQSNLLQEVKFRAKCEFDVPMQFLNQRLETLTFEKRDVFGWELISFKRTHNAVKLKLTAKQLLPIEAELRRLKKFVLEESEKLIGIGRPATEQWWKIPYGETIHILFEHLNLHYLDHIIPAGFHHLRAQKTGCCYELTMYRRTFEHDGAISLIDNVIQENKVKEELKAQEKVKEELKAQEKVKEELKTQENKVKEELKTQAFEALLAKLEKYVVPDNQGKPYGRDVLIDPILDMQYIKSRLEPLAFPKDSAEFNWEWRPVQILRDSPKHLILQVRAVPLNCLEADRRRLRELLFTKVRLGFFAISFQCPFRYIDFHNCDDLVPAGYLLDVARYDSGRRTFLSLWHRKPGSERIVRIRKTESEEAETVDDPKMTKEQAFDALRVELETLSLPGVERKEFCEVVVDQVLDIQYIEERLGKLAFPKESADINYEWVPIECFSDVRLRFTSHLLMAEAADRRRLRELLLHKVALAPISRFSYELKYINFALLWNDFVPDGYVLHVKRVGPAKYEFVLMPRTKDDKHTVYIDSTGPKESVEESRKETYLNTKEEILQDLLVQLDTNSATGKLHFEYIVHCNILYAVLAEYIEEALAKLIFPRRWIIVDFDTKTTSYEWSSILYCDIKPNYFKCVLQAKVLDAKEAERRRFRDFLLSRPNMVHYAMPVTYFSKLGLGQNDDFLVPPNQILHLKQNGELYYFWLEPQLQSVVYGSRVYIHPEVVQVPQRVEINEVQTLRNKIAILIAQLSKLEEKNTMRIMNFCLGLVGGPYIGTANEVWNKFSKQLVACTDEKCLKLVCVTLETALAK
jgi:hypothetical protein